MKTPAGSVNGIIRHCRGASKQMAAFCCPTYLLTVLDGAAGEVDVILQDALPRTPCHELLPRCWHSLRKAQGPGVGNETKLSFTGGWWMRPRFHLTCSRGRSVTNNL